MRVRRLFPLLAALAVSGIVAMAQSAGPSGVDEIDRQIAAIRQALSAPAPDGVIDPELAALTRIETSLAKQQGRNEARAIERDPFLMGSPRGPLYAALALSIAKQAQQSEFQLTTDLHRAEQAAAKLISNPKITAELWNAWVAEFQPSIARAKQSGPGLARRAELIGEFGLDWQLLYGPRKTELRDAESLIEKLYRSPMSGLLGSRSELLLRRPEFLNFKIRQGVANRKAWFAPLAQVRSLKDLPGAVARGRLLRQQALLNDQDQNDVFRPLEQLLILAAIPPYSTPQGLGREIDYHLSYEDFGDLNAQLALNFQDLVCQLAFDSLTHEKRKPGESVSDYLARLEVSARSSGNFALVDAVKEADYAMGRSLSAGDPAWYTFDRRVAVRSYLQAERLFAEGRYVEARRSYYFALGSAAGDAPAKMIGDRLRQMQRLDPSISIEKEWLRSP